MVLSDLCCSNLPSLVGARYIFTFIDDLPHFMWVYFLKKKNHVFEKFKEFKSFVEKKRGRPIKCLISENGGDYVNKHFEEYIG
jgi:hypothetical protein